MFVVTCAPQPTAAPKAPAAPAKAAWQAEWDKVAAAAKQEGQVIIFGGGGTVEESRVITQGMKDAFGIAAEVTVGSSASETTKIFAERKAGLYLRDGYFGGYNTILLQWKPEGVVVALDSALIQPHLSDPEVIKKVWYQGKLPIVDKDHMVLITSLQPRPTIAVNTSLVKEGELNSYRDLLNPKWKGKIIQHDPTVRGGGQQVFQGLWVMMGDDFVRELTKMELTLSRDERQVLDWVALGKMAIAIGPNGEDVPVYQKAGAPVKIVTPVEGTYVSAATSGFSLFNKPAHPNAAKVFLNWVTSKEGQELFAPAGVLHSLRLDVSTAHLRPEQMRQVGVKYYDASTEEESINRNEKAGKLAKELYEPLIKK